MVFLLIVGVIVLTHRNCSENIASSNGCIRRAPDVNHFRQFETVYCCQSIRSALVRSCPKALLITKRAYRIQAKTPVNSLNLENASHFVVHNNPGPQLLSSLQ